ncbi:MAG: hypothetical protein M5R42_10315 [Rhodocyclaceae bacterium]|nr:hypothetical protein [Rhodocyclaceae bacterium]
MGFTDVELALALQCGAALRREEQLAEFLGGGGRGGEQQGGGEEGGGKPLDSRFAGMTRLFALSVKRFIRRPFSRGR